MGQDCTLELDLQTECPQTGGWSQKERLGLLPCDQYGRSSSWAQCTRGSGLFFLSTLGAKAEHSCSDPPCLTLSLTLTPTNSPGLFWVEFSPFSFLLEEKKGRAREQGTAEPHTTLLLAAARRARPKAPCTHYRAAHRRHLLLCSLPKESRTGSFSFVQEKCPLLKSSSYSLQSICDRGKQRQRNPGVVAGSDPAQPFAQGSSVAV